MRASILTPGSIAEPGVSARGRRHARPSASCLEPAQNDRKGTGDEPQQRLVERRAAAVDAVAEGDALVPGPRANHDLRLAGLVVPVGDLPDEVDRDWQRRDQRREELLGYLRLAVRRGRREVRFVVDIVVIVFDDYSLVLRGGQLHQA